MIDQQPSERKDGRIICIKRVGPPNIYDHYPCGTLCEVSDGSLYQQISKDEEHPDWLLITDYTIVL